MEAETGSYLVVSSYLILKFHPVAYPGPGCSEPVEPEADHPGGQEPAFHLFPGCSRPLPQGCHSLWDCKLLKAVSQSHLLPNMWNEVGYTLGSHPQDLLLPWDHHTSVKKQGWDLWLHPPLQIMASRRPGEERPVVLGFGSGDARRWWVKCLFPPEAAWPLGPHQPSGH